MPNKPMDLSIKIEDTFNVSVDRLYEAWTNEDELKKWWKPIGTSLKSVETAVEAGGKIVYAFDDDIFKVTGEYEIVEPKSKLQYSWNWEFTQDNLKNESFTLQILFAGEDDQSTLSIKQEGFKNDEEKTSHEEGWKVGLEQLHQYLEG